MADIEIQPLTERLSDDEIDELMAALEDAGAPRLPRGVDGVELTIAEDIDETVLEEFLERLEALDAACHIYLPLEFEGRLSVGDLTVGSTSSLLEALEAMKEELQIDDEDSERDDDDLPGSIDAGELRDVWRLLHTGASEALERSLPLHIVS